MKTFDLFFKDFTPFTTTVFDESYEQWIESECKKNNATIFFRETHIRIMAPTWAKVSMVLVFIGYAYGMKENGR